MTLFRCAILGAATLAAPAAALAAPIDVFTLTGNGLNLSFSLSSTPKPSDSFDDLGFLVDNVKITANGQHYTASPAQFNLSDVGGGFALRDEDDLIEYFAFSGPQLFTGSVGAPTFLTGTFPVQAIFCPGQDPEGPQTCSSLPTYSLSITPQAVTPEPGSLLLLATGALGAAPLLRRRLRF